MSKLHQKVSRLLKEKGLFEQWEKTPSFRPETWEFCLAILIGAGYREIPARAIIGKKLRDHHEKDVVQAFEAAAGKADPVGYASKILRSKAKRTDPAVPHLGDQLLAAQRSDGAVATGKDDQISQDRTTPKERHEAYMRHRDKLMAKLRGA